MIIYISIYLPFSVEVKYLHYFLLIFINPLFINLSYFVTTFIQ